ncbi:Aste57867_15250 [Aphanomyces stellatus]|uniref:Aste57867_15250 protein n=1 Tax=Aphanomyces stellatus TaxID=120398 RepID=A0A485L408_9STRA|nr:hypothetical protein As57867_015194 [Aphanomyces stellatus]VFT92059.1 Aste57867_15250 [Aphanomyces stellatus]
MFNGVAPLTTATSFQGPQATDKNFGGFWRLLLTLQPTHTTKSRTSAFFGLGYLVLTLVLSVSYTVFLNPSLANNLFWVHCNTSIYEIYLIDLLNLKLQTTRQGSVDVLDTPIQRTYWNRGVQATFVSNYARRVLHEEVLTLPDAMETLRSIYPSFAVSIYTQYCWVDFDKCWELAHTATRATRCLALYQGNAANYVETLVRNTDWTKFLANNIETWPIVIDRPAAYKQLSVDDEVAYLLAKTLTRYELFWQNEIQMEVKENIDVVNALGYRLAASIKSDDAKWGPWTTLNWFWNFRNDLGIFAPNNTSIVRSAPNFFEVEGIEVAAMFGLQDANGYFNLHASLFYSLLL